MKAFHSVEIRGFSAILILREINFGKSIFNTVNEVWSRNFRIFTQLRFYVKTIIAILMALNFDFSKNLLSLETLVDLNYEIG